MPAEKHRGKNGSFYRWGKSGKKYYYTAGNKESRELAKKKANRQGLAIAYNKKIAKESLP